MIQYIKRLVETKRKASYESYEKQRRTGLVGSKLTEFCRRTDLHGYKYIVMEDLNIFERLCWAAAVLVSTGLAGFLVVTAYKWYARNPIITVIESTQGSIWDIPFPAVTICELNIISKRAARAMADNVTLPINVTADQVFEMLRYAPLLHSSYLVNARQRQMMVNLQTVLNLNNISLENLFKNLSPAKSCNDLVERCMWKNTIHRCDLLFHQTFTYYSLCCTFNYFAVNEPKLKRMTVIKHNVDESDFIPGIWRTNRDSSFIKYLLKSKLSIRRSYVLLYS